MQVVSPLFDQRAKGDMRPLSWRALMSFKREFLDDVEFFTIGVSTIGSSNIIKGQGDVIQEWDKYQYDDYTNRIKRIEITRQEESINSTTLAMGDIILDNHDDYFSPRAGSPIEDYILPYRPIKLFLGFGGENVQKIAGLTDKMPTIDVKNARASFHVIDFMYSLFNRPLDSVVVIIDATTDQALEYLMAAAGILPTQYDFDFGYNRIKFVFFDKGTKFGDAVKQLMVAEMGRFYMDEVGVIRFKNRQNYSTTPVYTFDRGNVIDSRTRTQDDIINVVEVKAKPREIQAKQKYWELQEVFEVPANSSVDFWADFEDPVTTIDSPEPIAPDVTSYFTANTNKEGDGGTIVTSNVYVSSDTLFTKSYKMTFRNDNAFTVYIRTMQLWATPAKVVKEIYVREEDPVSVNKYDERVLTIENDFISDNSDATSLARRLIIDWSEYAGINELTVKGNMALQIGDCVLVNDIEGFSGTYVITKIMDRFTGDEKAKYTQIIQVAKRDFRNYFTVGVSLIGYTDEIAP